MVVWTEAPRPEDALSSALRHAAEGLSDVVRMPITATPEVDDLGQRHDPVDLPQTGPGLWRTGYVFFPATDPLH